MLLGFSFFIPHFSFSMLTFIQTDASHPVFVSLVRLLDADLRVRDGEEHAFYSQFNKIDSIPYVILAYDEGKPVGCGAIKPFSPTQMEVKRMYVMPEYRSKGIASQILHRLEAGCKEMHIFHCVLETGTKQPEAIHLYEKSGYTRIPNYGQYLNVENSVCFEKRL